MATALIASARRVPDEYPTAAELVAVRAILRRQCHPPVVGGVDQVADVGHQEPGGASSSDEPPPAGDLQPSFRFGMIEVHRNCLVETWMDGVEVLLERLPVGTDLHQCHNRTQMFS